jgi:hypothetical protein
MQFIVSFSPSPVFTTLIFFSFLENGQKWMTSGVVHGNINLDTIRIGNMYGPPGTRGVLVDNEDSPVSSVLLVMVVDVID